jgi:hypothetical protein
MTPRLGTFYLSHRPGPDRQPITVGQGGGTVYVRIEVAPTTMSVIQALTSARPDVDEEVMNTHALPEHAMTK